MLQRTCPFSDHSGQSEPQAEVPPSLRQGLEPRAQGHQTRDIVGKFKTGTGMRPPGGYGYSQKCSQASPVTCAEGENMSTGNSAVGRGDPNPQG